jgi:hypothetical protein
MNFKQFLEMPLSHYKFDPEGRNNYQRSIDKDKLEKARKGELWDDVADAKGKISRIQVKPSHVGQKYVMGYFSNTDVALLSNQKSSKTLENKLKNVGYNFNILIFESSVDDDRRNVSPPSNYIRKINNYIRSNNITLENHITYVKNGSSGDPLTPWMILHTLGHAVAEEAKEILGADYYHKFGLCFRNTVFEKKLGIWIF